MRQYAIDRLRELSGIEADLHARGVALETLVDRMIHIDVQNPRNALQIVNAFVQTWWLAKKRETEELGTNRPGGLHEGSVTNHPIALGALCALKVNYPDFYSDLLEAPQLIQHFSDVVIRHKPLNEQPQSTQEILIERYLQKPEKDLGDKLYIKPEHRSLRQFLSSLIGLRWPESLQSLLLLSEDPTTRKFGANAYRIYTAFISGDTQGVLEGLGRHTDSNVLQLGEARLLYQMAEELRNESSARRASSSRVIADLVERLPNENSYLLIGSLCRELGDSLDLRCQLGIHKISRVLATAEAADRRAIASRLVEDVLTLDQDMSFKLETMEPPNIDEAVGFARDTVALALSVRKEHFLDIGSNRRLLDWLISRTVTTGGKDYQLPIRELEQWMNQHESHLLPDLSDRYLDLLASQLEGRDPPDFDVSAAVGRARKVFTILWDAGEDTRPTLWESLIRYVALRQPEASQAAWEHMVAHVSSPASPTVSGFVGTFARRLEKQTQDDAWQLDLNAGAPSLLSIVRTRVTDLSLEALQALSELDIAWSKKEETAVLSSDLLNELRRTGIDNIQQIVDDWTGRVLDNLPEPCVRLVASLFPSLSTSSQSAIAKQLQKIISNDNIDEPTGQQYEAFVDSVPDDVWDAAALKSHLDQLLPQIAARHNNPHGYLHRVFPPVSRVLHYASPGPLGQMLQALFTQAKGQPNHYAWLHSLMPQQWPTPSTDLKPYDPSQIFRDAYQFAVSNPGASSEGLLSSMRDMLDRELVSKEERPKVLQAACSAWSSEPRKAIETFREGFADLTPDQSATLSDGIDWTKEDHAILLTEAWGFVVQSQDKATRIETSIRILSKGPKGPADDPDRALRIWLDAQINDCRELVTETITRSDLNDAHRKRLWQQAIRLAEDFGSHFFLGVVPNVLTLPSVNDTAAAIFADADHVSEILGSNDQKAQLSQRLMESFTQASTKTIKAGIASWCKRLSGQAALGRLKHEALSDDDMAILYSEFPGSSILKNISTQRQE